MNPKRQQAIQRYIVNKLYQHLLDSKALDKNHTLEMTSDEMIINTKYLTKDIDSIIKNRPDELQNIILHLEKFDLEQIHPDHAFILKKGNKVEIKNTPASFIPEVIRYLESGKSPQYVDTLTELDRLFYEQKRLASFQDYLFV